MTETNLRIFNAWFIFSMIPRIRFHCLCCYCWKQVSQNYIKKRNQISLNITEIFVWNCFNRQCYKTVQNITKTLRLIVNQKLFYSIHILCNLAITRWKIANNALWKYSEQTRVSLQQIQFQTWLVMVIFNALNNVTILLPF